MDVSSTEMPKRDVLSMTKFTSFLDKYSYKLCSMYSLGSDILFAELKTPRLQKTFIVSIPNKYRLTAGATTPRRFHLATSDLSYQRHLDYLRSLKGPLIECDLLAISSTALCLYSAEGLTCYQIVDEEAISEPPEPKKVLDPVEKILSRGESSRQKARPRDGGVR